MTTSVDTKFARNLRAAERKLAGEPVDGKTHDWDLIADNLATMYAETSVAYQETHEGRYEMVRLGLGEMAMTQEQLRREQVELGDIDDMSPVIERRFSMLCQAIDLTLNLYEAGTEPGRSLEEIRDTLNDKYEALPGSLVNTLGPRYDELKQRLDLTIETDF